MNPKEKNSKVEEYKDFLENKLRSDLREIETKLDARARELKRWNDVKQATKLIRQHKEHVDRDLGIYARLLQVANYGLFARAEINASNNIFVKIGCDCLLEMDLDEADKYANIRIKVVQTHMEHLRGLAVQVKVNIKLVLLAINELNVKSDNT